MQKFRTAALIGAVVLAAAGLAGASAGELARTHILTVRLPDGSIEQIRYLGDRPPQIRFGPRTRAAVLARLRTGWT